MTDNTPQPEPIKETFVRHLKGHILIVRSPFSLEDTLASDPRIRGVQHSLVFPGELIVYVRSVDDIESVTRDIYRWSNGTP